jgi:hypothetical protein
MGLLEPVYRLPVVGCRPDSLKKIEKVLLDLGLIPTEEDAVEVPLAV